MSTAAVVEQDPLEEHLLEALRALQPSAALRSAPPEAEEIWRAQVDSRQADYAARWLQAARAELLHDRLGGSRVECGGRAGSSGG